MNVLTSLYVLVLLLNKVWKCKCKESCWMADKKQPHINEQFHTWLGLWKWRHACAASKHNAILLLGTYNKKMLQHVTCCLHTCPVTLLSEICRNRRFPMGLGHLGGWGRRPQSVYGLLEWCRYNFAAGSFHTKKLCSRVFFDRSRNLLKNNKIAVCATLWGS